VGRLAVGRPGFVNLQPLAGALLGVWWLREPLTPFLAAGGVLIVAGRTSR
jgi:drug/metabolite transporter (DMT)-like permease